jgi:SAM-dependent methyltransferase
MPASDHRGPAEDYVLGHSEHELERLRIQATLIDPVTRAFLLEAGIGAGMRVLDVGTGTGAVAFVAAGLVGDTGAVVGVDRSSVALAAARARADEASIRNVAFREGDPSEMAFEAPFDAVIGRYVLQFQTDPGAMLRRLVRHVRPGGVVVFHEVDWAGARSLPPSPTFDRCCDWILETFERTGTESRIGLKLHSAFLAAGLPAPSMRLGATVGGGASSANLAALIANLAGTMLPDMERLGVATAADVDFETLQERIVSESTTNGSVLVAWFDVAAWCRIAH